MEWRYDGCSPGLDCGFDAGPLRGLTLCAMRAFIFQHGGPSAFGGLSTGDVKSKFLLPCTSRMRCSYAALLSMQESPEVGRANAFISHAYFYEFLDVLEAVEVWESRQGGGGRHFYYFDLFVVNQHGQGSKVPFQVLRNEFGQGVVGAGRTLLVLDDSASAMRRLWCVFEVAVTCAEGIPFEVLMTRRHEAAFRVQLVQGYDVVLARTLNVDVELADAKEASDADNIRAVVRNGQGFLRTNQLVLGAMTQWMHAQGMAALADMPLVERGQSDLIFNLVGMLKEQGRHGEALPLQEEIFSAHCAALGESDAQTLSCLSNLGLLLKDLGRHAEAERALRRALEGRQAALPAFHPQILASLINLALVLRESGNAALAEPLITEALEGRRLAARTRNAVEGEDPDALACMVYAGMVKQDLGKVEEAELLVRNALKGRRAALPPGHPEVLYTCSALAGILGGAGDATRAAEAAALHEESVKGLRRLFGEGHLSTLRRVVAWAAFLISQGDCAAAAKELVPTLLRCQEVLGQAHAVTEECARLLASAMAGLSGSAPATTASKD